MFLFFCNTILWFCLTEKRRYELLNATQHKIWRFFQLGKRTDSWCQYFERIISWFLVKYTLASHSVAEYSNIVNTKECSIFNEQMKLWFSLFSSSYRWLRITNQLLICVRVTKQEFFVDCWVMEKTLRE